MRDTFNIGTMQSSFSNYKESFGRLTFSHRGLLETEGQLGGFLDVDLDLGWSMEDIHADCCIHSNLCYLFYQMNPPDTCRYYQPPSFGMIHLYSFQVLLCLH